MNATTTQSLKVFGPNIPFSHGATFEVHDANCGDCKKMEKLNQTYNAVIEEPAQDYSSLTDVVDTVYPPDNFECESGEYLFDFHFAPCVKLPLKAVG